MLAVPLKLTPPIVLAVSRAVAVPAFPVMVVWSPVFVPVTEPLPATVSVKEDPEYAIVPEFVLMVNVLPPLLIPVPPLADATTPVTLDAVPVVF